MPFPVVDSRAAVAAKPDKKTTRLIGWQGFLLHVPTDWDLTGFSGDRDKGYLRIDDGTELGLEVKWGTEPGAKKVGARAAKAPDVSVRRESYFRLLQQTAKKKKLPLDARPSDAPRGVLRPERTVAGFSWVGDKKAIGAVWYCATCRRTVIVQVLGPASGRGGLSTIAGDVLGALQCHNPDGDWQIWALYDLHTRVPARFVLEGQQLMNVYLRLSFRHKTEKLTVEQWSLANIARRNAFLDVWLAANAKGALRQARYAANESEQAIHGHAALSLAGGPAWGRPMLEAAREVLRFHRPATRFRALAWECEATNKVFAIEQMRPANAPECVAEIAARTRCHDEGDAADSPEATA